MGSPGKLTEAQIAYIRHDRTTPAADLALLYGVSRERIRQLRPGIFRRYAGPPRGPSKASRANEIVDCLPRRFWDKFMPEPNSGCWIWLACLTSEGYGRFKWRNETLAHRFAYRQLRGRIPRGKVIDHLCRSRWCVNPDHMEVTTDLVNCLRGESPLGRNARKTHCKRGHELPLYVPRGTRTCKSCAADSARTRYLRRRSAALPKESTA